MHVPTVGDFMRPHGDGDPDPGDSQSSRAGTYSCVHGCVGVRYCVSLVVSLCFEEQIPEASRDKDKESTNLFLPGLR